MRLRHLGTIHMARRKKRDDIVYAGRRSSKSRTIGGGTQNVLKMARALQRLNTLRGPVCMFTLYIYTKNYRICTITIYIL